MAVCFGFEYWNLGFIWNLEIKIWDLTNFLLDKKDLLEQSEFHRLNLVHNKVTMATPLQGIPNSARGLLPGEARG